MVECDDLAVNEAIRQSRSGRRDRAKSGTPFQTLAGLQGDIAVLDAHLDTVAVELDFADPIGARRRTLNRSTQLRRDERGHAIRRRPFFWQLFFRRSVWFTPPRDGTAFSPLTSGPQRDAISIPLLRVPASFLL
jgi:hypothetical protein